ncbi:MAG: 2OG-Fe(II) oxygenase [Candidatus Acidiferrales bacterium]
MTNHTDTINGIMSVLKDKITLPDSPQNLGHAYRTAKPFPHLIIDNMFPSSQLEGLLAEMRPLTADHWVQEDNAHLKKLNLRSAVDLGGNGFQHASFLHSAGFLYLLSELTGIWELLPDPYLQGAGYHIIPPGGKFDVHVDRNTAYETGLKRRLTLITYLNKSWEHDYGGQLELWNSDGTRCDVVVEPAFNRTIIFEIADKNYHGVPNPVAAPNGRSRNSFAVYYHTTASREQKDFRPHGSIYAPSFYGVEKNGSAFRRTIKDLTPPILVRGLKKLQKTK